MSVKTIELLATIGATLLPLYAYDNFDTQQKSLITALKNDVDPLRHLTSISALVFPAQHGIVPEDLQVPEALWESDEFNDKSNDDYDQLRRELSLLRHSLKTSACAGLFDRYENLNLEDTRNPQLCPPQCLSL